MKIYRNIHVLIFIFIVSCLSAQNPDIHGLIDQYIAIDSIKDVNVKRYSLNQFSEAFLKWFEESEVNTNELNVNHIFHLQSNDFETYLFSKCISGKSYQINWFVKNNITQKVYAYKEDKVLNDIKDHILRLSGEYKTISKSGYERKSLVVKEQNSQEVLINVVDLSLKCSFEDLFNAKNDDEKERLNDVISNKLEKLGKDETTFSHDFANIKRMKTIFSKDGKVKICTYNVENSGFQHHFYGAVMFKSDDQFLYFPLIDKTDKIQTPERVTVSNKKWFGALYLDVIDVKVKGETYYTLIGYKGHDEFVKRRVLDVMFLQGNRLSFGHPLFKTDKFTRHRMIYEYSAGTSMMLRYDRDEKMIVMDNLVPSETVYTGVYQFYGPDFTYNGFKFTKGYWELREDIDLRNSQ